MALGFPIPCERCHVRIMCEAGAAGGALGNERNCCKCVPKRLKVTLDEGSTGTGTASTTTCRIFTFDCETSRWGGNFTVDSTTIDILFYFERDTDDICWFYFESNALGLTEDNTGTGSSDTRLRIPLDTGTGTGSGSAIGDCLNPEFSFDTSIGTITTEIADYQTRAKTRRCPSTTGTGTGTGTSDCYSTPNCTDCNCFCRCLCITYTDSSTTVTTRVCWDTETESWTLAVGYINVVINFYCDPETGESKLSMADPWTGSPIRQDANCPEISATFNTVDDSLNPVSVSVICDACETCGGGATDPCGCDTQINNTLYATFEPGTAGTPPEPYPKSCLGATGTIAIVFDDATQTWIGFGTPFAGCSTVVYLRMTCTSDTPGAGEMKLEIGDSLVTMNDLGSVPITCDPFEASWLDVLLNLATDICCLSSGEPGTVNYNIFNIHITE